MPEEVNFQQLFVKTGEQHKVQVQKQQDEDEANKTLTESAKEMKLFREEAVPVIKGMPSVADIREATTIHPADNLEEQISTIVHSIFASVTLELSDTALGMINKLKAESDNQRKQISKMSKGVHLSYLSALCVGMSVLIVFIVAIATICYNEYILHDAKLTRLYIIFGIYLVVHNLVFLVAAKRWGGE